ncbi:MAG: D-alanine--D-alanine ligase [Chitinophagales bacterium]|nr:D-alanine--D-alanine ligase [Chitinophagales bacterium]
MSNKLNIAVLTGGSSAELEVSLKSASVVASNLDKAKYNVYRIDISSFPWSSLSSEGEEDQVDLNDFSLFNSKVKFDFVFIALHGTPAEDGKLQGYFDLIHMPYSAPSVLASAITFDKDITKSLVQDLPLNLAKSLLLNTNSSISDADILKKLSLPIFVKPNKNGSSYGVSKVKNISELQAALAKAFTYDDEVLVEEFIDGRELANGVFENKNELVVLPITEIVSENEFFDYEAKYQGKSKELTPAPLTKDQETRCYELSRTIFKRLKLKGFARIDYFLKGDDLYLLEVNTIPGLSAESILPQQALAMGYSLPEFFDIIIQSELAKKTI